MGVPTARGTAADKDKAVTKQTDTLRIAHSAMGCEWEISCWGRSNSYLRAACEQAFEAIDSIEEQLSVYRFASEVSRINHLAAGDDVLVDPVTFALLRRAVVLSQRTRGAFDITVGPLIKFWAMCKKQNRIPAQEEIAQVLKLIGRDHIQLDESAKTVRFGREGVEINMGAYGKGCAVDRAADIMLETDIPG
ncbi:MAG: FAD:protein FMN transferase, partial [Armatimonadota bacterium]